MPLEQYKMNEKLIFLNFTINPFSVVINAFTIDSFKFIFFFIIKFGNSLKITDIPVCSFKIVI